MAGNAAVFRAKLRGDAAGIRHKATLLVNGVTMKLYGEIVYAPEHLVDTGRARASWAISVEVPGDFLPPEVTAGGKIPPGDSTRWVSELAGAGLEAKRIIYSNVDYMLYIELGTETFEGMHVIALAVQRVLAGGSK